MFRLGKNNQTFCEPFMFLLDHTISYKLGLFSDAKKGI